MTKPFLKTIRVKIKKKMRKMFNNATRHPPAALHVPAPRAAGGVRQRWEQTLVFLSQLVHLAPPTFIRKLPAVRSFWSKEERTNSHFRRGNFNLIFYENKVGFGKLWDKDIPPNQTQSKFWTLATVGQQLHAY